MPTMFSLPKGSNFDIDGRNLYNWINNIPRENLETILIEDDGLKGTLANASNLFKSCINLVSVDLSSAHTESILNTRSMFAYCNNLSTPAVINIINMCINSTNISSAQRNLNVNNVNSPFYHTNKVSTIYQAKWQELRNAGWTY